MVSRPKHKGGRYRGRGAHKAHHTAITHRLLQALIYRLSLLGNKLLRRRYSQKVACSRLLYDITRRIVSKSLQTLLLIQTKQATKRKNNLQKTKTVFF